MKVSWKVNGLYKADAQKCYEEIGDRNTTAEEVVDIARNPNSELHKCFEWDDSIAGEKWRLYQAREIIRLLVIEETKAPDKTPVRVYSISDERKVYKPTKAIVRNVDQYQSLLERAKNELYAFERKYKSLVELNELFEAIHNI